MSLQAANHRPCLLRHRPTLLLAMALALLPLAGGCLWPTRKGPAPQELVECRQLTSRAANALQRSDYAEAESLLAQAVETCTFDPEARRQYAETLWQRGSRTEALQQLNLALELAGQDPALLTRRAEWRLAAGDAPGALADVDNALHTGPQAAGTWLLRARIARGANDYGQALTDYHKALCIDPGHREALWEKAQLHWLLAMHESSQAAEQWHRALASLQTLLDTYPQGQEPPAVLLLAGRTYGALARHGDAASMYALAAHRAPPDAELLYQLAEAQFRSGRPDQALPHLHQSLALAPGHAASQELLSRIRLALDPRGASR